MLPRSTVAARVGEQRVSDRAVPKSYRGLCQLENPIHPKTESLRRRALPFAPEPDTSPVASGQSLPGHVGSSLQRLLWRQLGTSPNG
jgi:hypothetical protein